MVAARTIWNRKNPHQAYSTASEDRDFREFFGCSAPVALDLWNRLVCRGCFSLGGTRAEHLLWTLMYMKLYPKRKAMSVLCGASKDTWTKRVYDFFDAIGQLEPEIVSSFKEDWRLTTALLMTCLEDLTCAFPSYSTSCVGVHFADSGFFAS